MKKYIIIIFISTFAILSCEKDDICIDATTPKLIILFYDNDNPTEKKQVAIDSIWVTNKSVLTGTKNVSLDSIAIPLDLSADNTIYKFKSNQIIDELNFNYTRKDVFVSRSCGYKTIFENLQIDKNTTNWIKEITITNSTIEDETAAHITIFH